ncbi:DUF2783 domain-containing protein [Pseudooceanicola spongiae]|uniref:DUF2783 domain-containing protein n=1 Tax=Pseudooceanicola spongiae TaxID=2613965 RepID=A0A7L9WRN9_9RHOB|nr:DUF2783 domain-containing protein [Pseudooceanicola spongiae]QOL82504.1 DUF2783 domain-containing protein [Pseudooceanicola spongiae]|tara:strand:+ start:698 stop:907 length:210 start_codon:yes stop_codon:yes gene_type:complete
MSLILTPNITAPDDAYAALIAAHEGLNKAQSDALNARLILILMNQVGALGTINAALETARAGLVAESTA